MGGRGRTCPGCQTELKLVLLPEPVGEWKAAGPKTNLPAAGAVFDYFDFRVCPECGRTLLYADDRARAKAAGNRRDDRGPQPGACCCQHFTATKTT